MQLPHLLHVALTVTDLDRSIDWYSRLLGGPPVAQQDEGSFRSAVWLEPVLGLHAHRTAPPDGARFDELLPGLDHVAFGCTTRDELVEWARHLDDLGIEHGGIVDAPYGSGLSFRDPDNIALELFCSNRRSAAST